MNKDVLRGKETYIVWIASVVNPLIAGFLFYYMWRKSAPNKAKKANKISYITAGVWVAVYILYKLITNSF